MGLSLVVKLLFFPTRHTASVSYFGGGERMPASTKTREQVIFALKRLRRGKGAGEQLIVEHAKQHGGATKKGVGLALKFLTKKKIVRFLKGREVYVLTSEGRKKAAPLKDSTGAQKAVAAKKKNAVKVRAKRKACKKTDTPLPAGGSKKSQHAPKSNVRRGSNSELLANKNAPLSPEPKKAKKKLLSLELGGNDDLSKALLASKVSRIIPGTNICRPKRPNPQILKDDKDCPFASRGLMPLLLRVGAFFKTFHRLLRISPFTFAQLKDALLESAGAEMPRLLHTVHHALLYHILLGARETEEKDREDIALQCDRRLSSVLLPILSQATWHAVFSRWYDYWVNWERHYSTRQGYAMLSDEEHRFIRPLVNALMLEGRSNHVGTGYNSLSLEIKLQGLQFLIDECLQQEAFAEYIAAKRKELVLLERKFRHGNKELDSQVARVKRRARRRAKGLDSSSEEEEESESSSSGEEEESDVSEEEETNDNKGTVGQMGGKDDRKCLQDKSIESPPRKLPSALTIATAQAESTTTQMFKEQDQDNSKQGNSSDVSGSDSASDSSSEGEESSSEEEESSSEEEESSSEEEDEEPPKELDEEELVYEGDPLDRKAIMAHRQRVRVRQAEVQQLHSEWEKREKAREKDRLAKERAEELHEARLIQKRDQEMHEVEKAREVLNRDYMQKRLDLMSTVHAGGGPLGMDRYFNVYHYLPEVDPSRLYIEPNYRVEDPRKTLHRNSDKVWGYYCFLEEFDQLCNYLNAYGRREYTLLTQLNKPHITSNMVKFMRCRTREKQEAEAQERAKLRAEKKRLREERKRKEEAEKQAARIAAGMSIRNRGRTGRQEDAETAPELNSQKDAKKGMRRKAKEQENSADSYVNKLEGQNVFIKTSSCPPGNAMTTESVALEFVRGVALEVCRWIEATVRVKVVDEDDATFYHQGMNRNIKVEYDLEDRHQLSQWILKCKTGRMEMCDVLTRVEYAVRCGAHAFGTDEEPLQPDSDYEEYEGDSDRNHSRGNHKKRGRKLLKNGGNEGSDDICVWVSRSRAEHARIMDMRELDNELKHKMKESLQEQHKVKDTNLAIQSSDLEDEISLEGPQRKESVPSEEENVDEAPPVMMPGWKDKVEYEENGVLDEERQEEVQWRYPLWRYPRSRDKFVDDLRSSLMEANSSSSEDTISHSTQFLHPPSILVVAALELRERCRLWVEDMNLRFRACVKPPKLEDAEELIKERNRKLKKLRKKLEQKRAAKRRKIEKMERKKSTKQNSSCKQVSAMGQLGQANLISQNQEKILLQQQERQNRQLQQQILLQSQQQQPEQQPPKSLDGPVLEKQQVESHQAGMQIPNKLQQWELSNQQDLRQEQIRMLNHQEDILQQRRQQVQNMHGMHPISPQQQHLQAMHHLSPQQHLQTMQQLSPQQHLQAMQQASPQLQQYSYVPQVNSPHQSHLSMMQLHFQLQQQQQYMIVQQQQEQQQQQQQQQQAYRAYLQQQANTNFQ